MSGKTVTMLSERTAGSWLAVLVESMPRTLNQ